MRFLLVDELIMFYKTAGYLANTENARQNFAVIKFKYQQKAIKKKVKDKEDVPETAKNTTMLQQYELIQDYFSENISIRNFSLACTIEKPQTKAITPFQVGKPYS